jgi:glycosyltransferase involved in cell wall biosynthesis
MIVKDESHVIKRCLQSVKGLIDYWVIVDTGSKDGTQEIIKEYLKEIPGELHERPWVNFGHNRNEALQLAQGKSDFLLFIDADDRLVFKEQFTLPTFEADAYFIVQKDKYKSTSREHLVCLLLRNNSDYRWTGILHEWLESPTPKQDQFLPYVLNEYNHDGARAKEPMETVFKDIELLKRGVVEEPENSARYMFYLAKSYWSIREYTYAIEYFEKRVQMGGNAMQVYHSLLFIAIGQKLLGYAPEIFTNSFSTAYLYRPSRVEALYELGRYYADTECYFLGYLLMKIAISSPVTQDNLFIESWMYDWGIPLLLFRCAAHLGYVDESKELLHKLLSNPGLPSEIRVAFELDKWKHKLESPTIGHAV